MTGDLATARNMVGFMARITYFLASALLAAAGVGFAMAQTAALPAGESGARSTADGIYTAAQAARGKAIYFENCASCHGGDLMGGECAPGFVGSEFSAKWGGKPLSGLHDFIMTQMPPGRAGVIGDRGTSDVMAFMLSANGLPEGAAELPVDSAALGQITVGGK